MVHSENNSVKSRIVNFIEDSITPFVNDPASFTKSWPLFGKENLFGLMSKAYRDDDLGSLNEHLILVEELCKVPISGFMISFLSQGWIIEILERLSTNDYHKKILDNFKKGEAIGSFCLTEPSYGSSYSNLATLAVNVNGKWDITGGKIYITNAAFANYFIVVANTGKESKQSISFFLLERDSVTIEKEIEFMGNRNSGISKLKIKCKNMDEKHLLGKVGVGFLTLPQCLNYERMDISLYSVFLAKECLIRTNSFLRKRKNQGERITDYQVIRYKLVNMYSRLEIMKSFVLSTAKKFVLKEECSKDILISKIYSTETARDIILEAIQLTGAYGFTEESKLISMFNDIAPLAVGGGSNDVLRNALFRSANSLARS